MLPSEWKKKILQGILGADLIGFHTYDYVQHLMQSLKMILKVESQYNTITIRRKEPLKLMYFLSA
jgi:trehalose 6-phosphate synthase/phosphatase